MKKGQLTVFMILGVVILIVFLFILFLVNSVQVGTLEGEKEQVLSQLFDKEGLRIFVEDCLEDNLQDGLELLAQQGTIWEDQGGRKTFIEGIALGENSDEENIRVAYAISHADYTPDNQYPCRDGTPNGFCEYKYPTTTILKGDQHVFLSTLQSNLAQFLQTRTASCVQDKVRADVSEAADFSDEDLTFSTIFRDSGVNVEVHFPMRFSIGGSEEFFQISEFDFFYPTKFKQALEVIALQGPLEWDRRFLDFEYDKYHELIMSEDTFTFASEIDTSENCVFDEELNYYSCERRMSVDKYKNLDIELGTIIEVNGDSIIPFIVQDGTNELVFQIARQNRPPALSWVDRCPAEGYDYLIVEGATNELGKVVIDIVAKDPDEDSVKLSLANDDGDFETITKNYESSVLPEREFTVRAEDDYLADWQKVKVKKDPIVNPNVILTNALTGSEIIALEDPVCVKVEPGSLPEGEFAGAFEFSLGSLVTPLVLEDTEFMIPGESGCDPGEITMTLAEIKQAIGEVFPTEGEFTQSVEGKVVYDEENPLCQYDVVNDLTVTVQKCSEFFYEGYPYPYVDELNALYLYDELGEKGDERPVVLASHACCIDGTPKEAGEECFSGRGCFENEYHLKEVTATCDGERGNVCGNVVEVPGPLLCGGEEFGCNTEEIDPVCAGKPINSLIATAGWCGGINEFGCGEVELCTSEVVFSSEGSIVGFDPVNQPSSFSCGCGSTTIGKLCDNSFNGNFDGECIDEGFWSGVFGSRYVCEPLGESPDDDFE
ncbi:hypothetical protein HOC32_04850 [Candidatus Woesearchaeota archaeon]|nr:hypothetical protein [Candidatus Woesearchaeota archaeon]